MGSPALYLWGTYLVAVVALLIEVALLLLRRRNIRQFLGGRQKAGQG